MQDQERNSGAFSTRTYPHALRAGSPPPFAALDLQHRHRRGCRAEQALYNDDRQ